MKRSAVVLFCCMMLTMSAFCYVTVYWPRDTLFDNATAALILVSAGVISAALSLLS